MYMSIYVYPVPQLNCVLKGRSYVPYILDIYNVCRKWSERTIYVAL